MNPPLLACHLLSCFCFSSQFLWIGILFDQLLVLISPGDVIFQKSLRHILPTWSSAQSPDPFLMLETASLGETLENMLS